KSDLSVILYQADSVTNEPARRYELTRQVHGRNRMACRECNDLFNPAVEKKSLPTSNAPIRAWTKLTKAASISRSVPAFNTSTLSPMQGAATSRSFVVSSNVGLFGF